MNIPYLIDRRALSKMAAPDETHCVRVILEKVNNPVPYRLKCRLRQYVFERDGKAGVHLLDIPVSVWMANMPAGPHRKNESIAFDLRPTAATPFEIQVIPWQGAAGSAPLSAPLSAPPDASIFGPLRDIAEHLGAPPMMARALDLAAAGDADALRLLLASAPPRQGPPATSAAAERARKMREAKAAKKAKREANLQPA